MTKLTKNKMLTEEKTKEYNSETFSLGNKEIEEQKITSGMLIFRIKEDSNICVRKISTHNIQG